MHSYKTKLKKIQFEIHLAEHCNLNCQMCDHYSPLAEPEYLDIQEFEKYLNRLSHLFKGEATYIRLLGGEPLLNEGINEFLSLARRYFPKSSIEIFTNGILLPLQPESFWKACKSYGIIIVVTKYQIALDYRAIEEIAKKNGVLLAYYNKLETVKTSWKLPLSMDKGFNPYDNFYLCDMGNKCIFLYKGDLYPCTVIPNVRHLNSKFGLNFEVSSNDRVNIFAAKDADEILEFLRNPVPFCRYCDIQNRSYNHTWKQSQKLLSEWV